MTRTRQPLPPVLRRTAPWLAAAAALAALLSSPLFADEGQWTPAQLASFPAARWEALRARGLALSPAELWDGAGGGLMGAVVNLGGCTAAFVSPDGLLATNHHCAFGALQHVSTPQRNVLRDGLVTRSRADEPAAPAASRAVVLRKVTDVTERLRGTGSAYAKATTDHARWEAVERTKKELVGECEKQPSTRCTVATFGDGASFELHEGLELTDLRLVWAPSRAVGDFGGEEDNWSWPRHAADITLMRAYVSPSGKPAPYAKENVPYRPARFLRVTASGVAPGTLVSILGFPGRTQRLLDAASVEELGSWAFPLRARTAADRIALLEAAGKESPEVALKVASTIKSLANGEKNARGQVEGLARNGVVARARREEADLAAWLAAHPEAPAAWRTAAAELGKVLAADRAGRDRRYFLEELERAPGLLGAALRVQRWASERSKPDLEREAGYQERDLPRAKGREADVTRSLAPAAERKVVAYLAARALAAAGDRPGKALSDAFGATATEASIEKKLAEWDGRTKLLAEETRLALLTTATPATLAKSDDPYLELAAGLAPDLAAIRRGRQELGGALLRLRPPFIAALQALRASRGQPVYPDANGTLRIAFAGVKGYSPREAVTYAPQTSLRGLVEKNRGADPFALPEKVLAAATAPHSGPLADPALGTVPVDFLADGDTTGGNSGSPVVNGKGELVGLNFDRVFEAVAGDFGWSPAYSRNVCLDIRYALWLLGTVDRATETLQELTGSR